MKWFIITATIITIMFIPAWQRGGSCDDGAVEVCPLYCEYVGVGELFDVESLDTNVEFFKSTVIDNAVNGYMVHVYRNAAEGLDYVRFYIKHNRHGYVATSHIMDITSGNRMTLASGERMYLVPANNHGIYLTNSSLGIILEVDEATHDVYIDSTLTLNPLATYPGTVAKGRQFYKDDGKDTLFIYDGAAWQVVWAQP